jgi:hypothetical protein
VVGAVARLIEQRGLSLVGAIYAWRLCGGAKGSPGPCRRSSGTPPTRRRPKGFGRIVVSQKRGTECASYSGIKWTSGRCKAAVRPSPALDRLDRLK